MKDFNKLEERNLKLRRCETERFNKSDLENINIDNELATQKNITNPEDMMKEILRLRAENADYKLKIHADYLNLIFHIAVVHP